MSTRLAKRPRCQALAPFEKTLEKSHLTAQCIFLGVLGIAFASFAAGALSRQPSPPSPAHVLFSALAFVGAVSVVSTIALLAGTTLIARRATAEKEEAGAGAGGASAGAGESAAAVGDPEHLADERARDAAGFGDAGASRPEPIVFSTRRIAQSVHHLLEIELARYELTPQERIVAEHILRDETYAAIGRQLYLTESTVKFHARNVFAKAGVSSKREFIALVEDNMARLPD